VQQSRDSGAEASCHSVAWPLRWLLSLAAWPRGWAAGVAPAARAPALVERGAQAVCGAGDESGADAWSSALVYKGRINSNEALKAGAGGKEGCRRGADSPLSGGLMT
jgi:hypothetical protein